MSAPPPMRNMYFQTAILDPASKMPSAQHSTYRSTSPLPAPSPATGTIKLIVGSSPPNQRIWFLPRALLTRHSTHLASLCANPHRKDITMSDMDPHAFANFVDYMRSSIYTLNTQVHDFHRVRAGAEASILGERLGALEYADAAIRALHMAFEAVSKLRTRGMRKCVIRAEDVQFVCEQDGAVGKGLKKMFCDATASMWRQNEVYMLKLGQVEGWKDVYEKCDMFRETMIKSLGTRDRERGALLRPVKKYLDKKGEVVKGKENEVLVKKEVISDSEDERESRSRGVVRDQRRKILTPRMKFPAFRRRGSSERRRIQRAEAGERDADAAEDLSAGIVSEQEAGGEEAVIEGDWMLVDAKSEEKT